MTRLETIAETAITTAIETAVSDALTEIATKEIRRVMIEREDALAAIVKTAVANAAAKLFDERG